MNYAFFGTPRFAAIILEELISAGIPPKIIVANPDRPSGRKKVITPPQTKIIAQKHGIGVLQPEKLDDETFVNAIKKSDLDFFVVAAYSKIIPQAILAIPRLGTIGVHPSILPKYRGATPIQSVILKGEKETGVTLYLLDEKVDHGPILLKKIVSIAPEDTYETLLGKIANVAGKALTATLPEFVKGNVKPAEQDETQATYTKKFTTEDGFISEDDLEDALSGKSKEKIKLIHNKIRALNPEPGVWTVKNGKRTKILEAVLENGYLKLLKTQMEGERPKTL